MKNARKIAPESIHDISGGFAAMGKAKDSWVGGNNNLKLLSRTAKFVLIIALFFSCCAMTGCIESNFRLASESRLPKFVTLPPGLTRADVTVEMTYYTPPWGAQFILRDKKGRTLEKVYGKQRSNPFRGYYPGYEVITANGITEIIEHRRMEPIFYVTDDLVQLRAKVVAVNELGGFSGNALPVDIDPRFALTIRIDTVAPNVPELKPGSEVTFAIHSPALVFGDDPQNGKTYEFDLCRKVTSGEVKFSQLGVRFKGGSLGGCG